MNNKIPLLKKLKTDFNFLSEEFLLGNQLQMPMILKNKLMITLYKSNNLKVKNIMKLLKKQILISVISIMLIENRQL